MGLEGGVMVMTVHLGIPVVGVVVGVVGVVVDVVGGVLVCCYIVGLLGCYVVVSLCYCGVVVRLESALTTGRQHDDATTRPPQ